MILERYGDHWNPDHWKPITAFLWTPSCQRSLGDTKAQSDKAFDWLSIRFCFWPVVLPNHQFLFYSTLSLRRIGSVWLAYRALTSTESIFDQQNGKHNKQWLRTRIWRCTASRRDCSRASRQTDSTRPLWCVRRGHTPESRTQVGTWTKQFWEYRESSVEWWTRAGVCTTLFHDSAACLWSALSNTFSRTF